MSDIPTRRTAVSSFLNKLTWILLAFSAQNLWTDKYASAISLGLLAIVFYHLSVTYPVLRRHVKKPSFLRLLMERIAGNRLLRNGVLIACIGYFVLSGYLTIHGLRSEFDSLVEPRAVTEKQADLILKHLPANQAYTTTVRYDIRDQEASEYGRRLSSVIASANWKMAQPDDTLNPDHEPILPLSGVIIAQYSSDPSVNDPVRQYSQKLRDTFRAAGIEIGFSWVRSDANRIFVCVGHRPLRIVDEDDLLHKLDRWVNHKPYR